MSEERPVPAPVSTAPPRRPGARVEYLDFRDLEGYREYRFRVYGPDGASECFTRIAKSDFESRLVRISDGPDLCYQQLVRAIAEGAAEFPVGMTTIVETDLSRYRDEHAPAPRRRSSWKPRDPAQVAEAPKRPQYRPTAPKRPSAVPAALPTVADVEPILEEGQRVKHAIFGMGVTVAATTARTVISFDRGGPKTFVTSLLEVEVMSAPHTWEMGPRGANRPRQAAEERTSPPADDVTSDPPVDDEVTSRPPVDDEVTSGSPV